MDQEGGDGPISPQEYAPRIAPDITSPLHQHLFSLRLDWELDGTPNTLLEFEEPNVSEQQAALSWQTGVVVSSLSQFPVEEEVLFAPCLLLELRQHEQMTDGERELAAKGDRRNDHRAVARGTYTRLASSCDPELQAAMKKAKVDPSTVTVCRVRPHVAPWGEV